MSCDQQYPVQEISSSQPERPTLGSCLVQTKAESVTTLSDIRETDARTALKRGLSNYLMSLPPFTHPTHQRIVQLKRVYDVWPDQEEKAEYPAVTVYSKEKHEYEASGFSPVLDPNCQIDATTYLVKYSELNAQITIDIMTTDPEERICFGMQMENALNPVDWMYGFQLKLPHYHGLLGVFQLIDGNYPDDEPSVFSRNRHLTYVLSAQVPVVRVKKYTPLTEVRAEVTVVDGNTDC